MWNVLKRSRNPDKPNLTDSARRGNFVREFACDGYVVPVDESNQTLALAVGDDDLVSPQINRLTHTNRCEKCGNSSLEENQTEDRMRVLRINSRLVR